MLVSTNCFANCWFHLYTSSLVNWPLGGSVSSCIESIKTRTFIIVMNLYIYMIALGFYLLFEAVKVGET